MRDAGINGFQGRARKNRWFALNANLHIGIDRERKNKMIQAKQTQIYVSPSSLRILENCPKCFYMSIINKIKRPSGGFPTLGGGIDLQLKKHYDKYMEKGELPPEIIKHKINAKLFSDIGLLEVWRSNFKGIQAKDNESGIILRGAVDHLLEKDGKIIVLDFKTRGYDLKENTHHDYVDQMNIYNYLLRRNGYETHDYSYLMFYIFESVDNDGTFIFKTELVEVPVDIKHAQNLFTKAIKVLQGDCPASSEKCEYCNWKGK